MPTGEKKKTNNGEGHEDVVVSRISEHIFKILCFEKVIVRPEHVEFFTHIQGISSRILNIKQEIKYIYISKCLITVLKQMSHLAWSLL